MYIPNLTEDGMDQLVALLNNQLKNKEFTIIYISKSNGNFNIDENGANFTARVITACESLGFIEIRYSYEGKQWAAFEINITAEVFITKKIVQITTKPGDTNGLRNIIIHL